MLDANIDRHTEDMKFYDAKGNHYPKERMLNLQSLMHEKTGLKRRLKMLHNMVRNAA